MPNATRRVYLEYPGAHKGPGWIPIELMIKGGRHVDRLEALEYKTAFKQPVLVGDVTGDGLDDLLLGYDRRSISGMEFHPDDMFKVFLGERGPHLFAEEAIDVIVPMPDADEYVWLVDINRDGKKDILLQYPDCCRGDYHRERTRESHKVTIMIAK